MKIKFYKNKYIYKKTHLPKEGWLQGCFICNEITGNYELFKKYYDYENKIMLKIYVYVCNKCKNKIVRESEIKYKYNNSINEYIKVNNWLHFNAQ